MPYKIEITSAAQKDFNRLPTEAQDRIRPAIRALADNPRPDGVEKMVDLKGVYRLRVGQYRVGYEIRDRELIITVIGVGKRDEIYHLIKKRVK